MVIVSSCPPSGLLSLPTQFIMHILQLNLVQEFIPLRLLQSLQRLWFFNHQRPHFDIVFPSLLQLAAYFQLKNGLNILLVHLEQFDLGLLGGFLCCKLQVARFLSETLQPRGFSLRYLVQGNVPRWFKFQDRDLTSLKMQGLNRLILLTDLFITVYDLSLHF